MCVQLRGCELMVVWRIEKMQAKWKWKWMSRGGSTRKLMTRSSSAIIEEVMAMRAMNNTKSVMPQMAETRNAFRLIKICARSAAEQRSCPRQATLQAQYCSHRNCSYLAVFYAYHMQHRETCNSKASAAIWRIGWQPKQTREPLPHPKIF